MNLLRAASLAVCTAEILLCGVACGGKVTYEAQGFGGAESNSANSTQPVSTIASIAAVTNNVAVTNVTVVSASSGAGGTCANIPAPVGTVTFIGGTGSGGTCDVAYQDAQKNVLGSSCTGSQCTCGWSGANDSIATCTCQTAGDACAGGLSCCPWTAGGW